MNRLFNILLSGIFSLLTLLSCRNEEAMPDIDPLIQWKKVTETSNEQYTIEIYSHDGTLQQGYNDMAFRVKNNATQQFEKLSKFQWQPIMNMKHHKHSCPAVPIPYSETVQLGYAVFQMHSNDAEGWQINFEYTIGNKTYQQTANIEVKKSAKRRVNVFTDEDGMRYILAYISPRKPIEGLNAITVGLWKMEDMHTFTAVKDYTIKIDPRMPSMGNHSSPHNQDAVQGIISGIYNGTLSLTMSGYWKINLQVLDAEGNVVKGEAITDDNPESSIFFEVEL